MDNVGGGRIPHQKPYHSGSANFAGFDDQNVSEPRSIEEMQQRRWREQLFGIGPGRFPQNPLHGTRSSVEGGSASTSGLGLMTAPPTQTPLTHPPAAGLSAAGLQSFTSLGGSIPMNSNIRGDHPVSEVEAFSSPNISLNEQIQRAQQQQQQQQTNQSFASHLASMQQQQLPSSSLSLQEQLHRLQQQQELLQQQRQMAMMNTRSQGFPSFSGATSSFSENRFQQLQLQQQQLMTNESRFDTAFTNALQTQIQGGTGSLSATSNTMNQMMGMMPWGPASFSTNISVSGDRPSFLSPSAAAAAAANSATLNQSPIAAEPSPFLGKIPGQDISLSQCQSMTESNTSLLRSPFNVNPLLSGFSTSAMRLPAQVYPEGRFGGALSAAPMLESSNQGSAILKPLSAYNYFFTEERDRILHGDGRFGIESNDARKMRLLSMHWSKDRNQRRPHRRTHGKISFTNLSKHIGQKWRELSEDEKNFYKSVAKADMARYKEEIAKRDRQESNNSTVALAAAPSSNDDPLNPEESPS
jgi:hypothetical protein